MTSFLAVPVFALAKLGEILLTPFGFPTVNAEKLALFCVSVVAEAVSVMFSIPSIPVTGTADSLLRFAAPTFTSAAWSAAVLFTCVVEARTWVPPSLDICAHHSVAGPQHSENNFPPRNPQPFLPLPFHLCPCALRKRKKLIYPQTLLTTSSCEQLAIAAHAFRVSRFTFRVYPARSACLPRILNRLFFSTRFRTLPATLPPPYFHLISTDITSSSYFKESLQRIHCTPKYILSYSFIYTVNTLC